VAANARADVRRTDGNSAVESGRWSSGLAFYLAAIGASVGLGSIWRFPYLVGANGGSAFVLIFILACLTIATPLLVAEFIIGRRARVSPPEAAGVVAESFGRSAKWNVIGILGTVAAFLIISYYTVIAGWVLAYTWKCATGQLTGLSPPAVHALFRDFLASPLQVGAWHAGFVVLAAAISARGLNRGIEVANKIRAPGLLVLLLLLVVYAWFHGDLARGLTFAFVPDFAKITPRVVLVAIGQAFYATGVGMGMMLAYGAYVPRGASLVRSALGITGSIVLVSVMATLLVFPLVYRYGLDPAQGPDLVFKVLPVIFAEMPAGRLIGTLFFLLLILAALTPTIAGLEPLVAWLEQRRGLPRTVGVTVAAAATWLVGLGSVLSFNLWAHWYPFDWLPRMRGMTFFDTLDFATSNAMLPAGALLTCILMAWRLPRGLFDGELQEEAPAVRRFCRMLLRYLCPLAIAAVLVMALV
jgi:neurotransmitter:Na+ symporter, NSS family